MPSRGIRNNNPGNIRKSKDKWQGLSTSQLDKEFFSFKEPTYGIRAIARILIAYQDDHDLDTVKKIINRWAPPNENDTNAYVRAVGKATGTGPNGAINTHRFEDLYPLVEAIILHENGSQPYSRAVITKGLVLAGVEPTAHKDKSIASTNTVKVATAGATASVAAPVLTVLDKFEEHSYTFDRIVEYGPWALALIGAIAFGYFVYVRWDDRRKGLR